MFKGDSYLRKEKVLRSLGRSALMVLLCFLSQTGLGATVFISTEDVLILAWQEPTSPKDKLVLKTKQSYTFTVKSEGDVVSNLHGSWSAHPDGVLGVSSTCVFDNPGSHWVRASSTGGVDVLVEFEVVTIERSRERKLLSRPIARIDLLVDISSNGVLDAGDNEGETGKVGRLLGTNNGDEDNDGHTDCYDNKVNGRKDLNNMGDLKIGVWTTMDSGFVRLSTDGNNYFRIFDDRHRAVIGPKAGKSYDIPLSDIPDGGLPCFKMEGIKSGAEIDLELTLFIFWH